MKASFIQPSETRTSITMACPAALRSCQQHSIAGPQCKIFLHMAVQEARKAFTSGSLHFEYKIVDYCKRAYQGGGLHASLYDVLRSYWDRPKQSPSLHGL